MELYDDTQRWKKVGLNIKCPSLMNEKLEWKFQPYDGGGFGKKQQYFSDSSNSDIRETVHRVPYDSDSNSDPHNWTENPPTLRKAKRSDTQKQVEKHFSRIQVADLYTDNDSENGNVALASERRHAKSKDGTGRSRGSSKYHKLEEMRSKRLNLSITSDEEGVTQETETVSRSVGRVGNSPATCKEKGISRSRESPKSHNDSEIFTKINHQEKISKTSDGLSPSTAMTWSPLSRFNNGIQHQALTIEYSRRLSQQIPNNRPETVSKVTHRQALDNHPQFHNSIKPGLIHEQVAVSISQQPLSCQTTGTRLSHTSQTVLDCPRESNNNRLTTQAGIDVDGRDLDSDGNVRFSQKKIFGNSLQSSHETETSFRTKTGVPLKSRQNRTNSFMPRPGIFSHSDDSLDELVKSNIRYLDNHMDTVQITRQPTASSIRIHSLENNRKINTTQSNLGQQSPPSIPVRANTSIERHVSLPKSPKSMPQIAASGENNVYRLRKGDNPVTPQPFVLPRKNMFNDCSIPENDQNIKNSLNKFKVQKIERDLIPHNVEVNLQSEQSNAKSFVVAELPGSTQEDRIHVDKGMFSDAEYEIEVSERVRKWEKLMKIQGRQSSDIKNLITIDENMESETLVAPSVGNIQGKAIVLSQDRVLDSSHLQKTVNVSSIVGSSRHGYERSIKRLEHLVSPGVGSIAPTTNKRDNVVQDSGLKLQPQNVSKELSPWNSLRHEDELARLGQFPPKMNEHASPVTSEHIQVTCTSIQSHDYEGQVSIHNKSLSLTGGQETDKRGPSYTEELQNISATKSVSNLRRHFDPGSTTATSEDDQRSVSIALAKLSRPPKKSKLHDSDSMDWSLMFPGCNTKIQDSYLWSPSLESTQGVTVSIERVAARTLQTIPFSEDPFWKEIEQMTSFSPTDTSEYLNSSVPQKSALEAERMRSDHHFQLLSPQCFTLPNQPRNSMTAKDRIPKSKSLYTPNIRPSKICLRTSNHDHEQIKQSNHDSISDEVLADNSRCYRNIIEEIPHRKLLDEDCTPVPLVASNVLLTNQTDRHQPSFRLEPGIMTNQTDRHQPSFRLEPGLMTIPTHNIDRYSNTLFKRGYVYERGSETSQLPQPTQLHQHKQQQLQINTQTGHQAQQGSMSNYQLDPYLLSHKLLTTGLVEETDIEGSTDDRHDKSVSTKTDIDRESRYAATIFYPESTPHKAATTVSYPEFTSHKAATTVPYPEHFNYNLSSQQQMTSWPKISNKPSVATTNNATSSLVSSTKQPEQLTVGDTSSLKMTSYQPDAATLYGTSRPQSFMKPSLNLSQSGSEKTKDDETDSHSDGSSGPSYARLENIYQSMNSLTNLARDVEHRINVIKSRLATSHENNLDSIISSLKQLAPENKHRETEPASFEDFYMTKKSKLSDALTELDRIYNSLELHSSNLAYRPENQTHNSSESRLSRSFVGPQPKSVHLRPMQTRISSVFIRGIDTTSSQNGNQENQSEFDIVSKSLQKIVDDVNQTTHLLSLAAQRNRHENIAPETHKFKVKVKPKNMMLIDDVSPTVKTLQVTADSQPPRKQENTVVDMFTSKCQGNLAVSESINDTSQSVSQLGTKTGHIPISQLETKTGHTPVSQLETKTGHIPVAQLETKTGHIPVSQLETKPGHTPVSQLETTTGHTPVSRLETKTGHTPVSQLETKTGHYTLSHLETKTGHTPVSQLETKTGHDTLSQLETKTGHTPVSQLETKTGHTPVSQLETKTGHTPMSQLETKTGHTPMSQLETKTGHDSMPQLDTSDGHDSVPQLEAITDGLVMKSWNADSKSDPVLQTMKANTTNMTTSVLIFPIASVSAEKQHRLPGVSEQYNITNHGTSQEQSNKLFITTIPSQQHSTKIASSSNQQELFQVVTDKTFTASKTDQHKSNVLKSGTVNQESSVLKSETVSQELSVLKSGTVSKELSVSKSGTANQESSVLKSGTVNQESSVLKSGTVNQESNVLKSGTVNQESNVLKSETVNQESNVLKSETVNQESNVLKSDMAQKTIGSVSDQVARVVNSRMTLPNFNVKKEDNNNVEQTSKSASSSSLQSNNTASSSSLPSNNTAKSSSLTSHNTAKSSVHKDPSVTSSSIYPSKAGTSLLPPPSASSLNTNITPSTSSLNTNITPSTSSLNTNITPSASSLNTNITPSTSSLNTNITPSASLLNTNITPSTSSLNTNITPSASSLNTNITRSASSLNTNITPSASSLNTNITPSASSLNTNITPSASSLNTNITPSASSKSTIMGSSVSESDQLMPALTDFKLDESDSFSKTEHKTKRRLGIGVAMLLDRFRPDRNNVGTFKTATSGRQAYNLSGSIPVDSDDIPLVETKHTEAITNNPQLKCHVLSSIDIVPILSSCEKISVISLDKKPISQKADVLNSGSCSSQSSLPVNKPPQSSWKKQTPDTERQNVQEISSKYGSSKTISKVPQPASSNDSSASEGYFTPSEMGSP